MSGPRGPTPIVQAGDPVLRGLAGEVPASLLGTAELRELAETMVATMRAAPGVGLAAPQIGIPWRLIVLEDREELLAGLPPEDLAARERTPLALTILVNPTLRLVGDATATFFEGCLSVDGWAALVERQLAVEVEGLDLEGRRVGFAARGWPARILQHELDHLDGTLYVDRMLTRTFATVEAARSHYAGKAIAEVRRMLGV